MSNKIVTRKITNAIFLAAILLAGTFVAISPSFIIGVNAQYEPKHGMDNDYKKSYVDESYGHEYPDKDYNSYEPDYGMDKRYNSYVQEPHGKDTYELDYPSYKPDYSSYGKDDREKSKDSKSVSINKIKCINNNVNINGNNAGNISIGNKGQGYLGGYSSDGSGGYYGEGYGKQDKGFDCIINNNNNNIAGGGNQTTPPKATLNVTKIVTCTYQVGGLTPETACGLIEEDITENQFLIEVTNDNPVPSQFPGSESGTIVTLGAGNYVVSETFDAASLQAEIELIEAELKRLAGGGGVRDYEITGPIVSFTGDCTAVNLGSEATGTIAAGESQTCEIENHFDIGLAPLIDEICNNQIDDDLDGLVDDEDPDCSPPGGLTASNINTDVSAFDINTSGGLATSFSSPPTIAQGTTEEDSSALEKITKLKQQWLELLP